MLIYLVLAAQFESFRDPFIILAGSVPLAVAGALLFSFLGFTSLNIYSQVGLITLVGLVAKNGILIVEFANHLQESGKAKLQAILEASETRLRPILMTTAATVVGHFPLVIATGPGAGARNSIGVMLVSGMIIGTLFTLFVVPSIYMLLARTRVAEPAAVQDDARHRGGAEPGAVDVVEQRLATTYTTGPGPGLACCCGGVGPAQRLHGRGRRHRPGRHRTERRRRLAVVRRRLVGRPGLDHRRRRCPAPTRTSC